MLQRYDCPYGDATPFRRKLSCFGFASITARSLNASSFQARCRWIRIDVLNPVWGSRAGSAAPPLSAEYLGADSDEVAQACRYEVARRFRDDVAHLSDLISPGGEAFWPVGSLASVKPDGQSGIAT
ncbi:hypothetical protein [Bradyrhizobium sp. CCBAU 53421]|uniref:hypothetical protein n=1 Tax=Bradyrhizobium sp. CCBAU 53421 TaxID=1325120 RepID=UPI001889F019|nr:hypothetical protein [Bradyrhizobium sp. CCBAU 53421]